MNMISTISILADHYEGNGARAGLWYWLIFILSIILGAWSQYPFERKSGIWLIVFILFGLLGYSVYGGPLQ